MLITQVEAFHTYVALTIVAVLLVAVWLAFLVWGRLSGQFDDVEEARYRVFEDDVPARPGGGTGAANEREW